MPAMAPAQQRNAVSEGIALGLLMCDCTELPYDKFRIDLAFEKAWRAWPYRNSFSQVSTDLRKGLAGSLVMTRASEKKQTFLLYWARERSLIICQRGTDWNPNVPEGVQFALEVIGADVPLDGWVSLARDLLTNLGL